MESGSSERPSHRRPRVSEKKRTSAEKMKGEGEEVMSSPQLTDDETTHHPSSMANPAPVASRVSSRRPAVADIVTESFKPSTAKSRPTVRKVPAPEVNPVIIHVARVNLVPTTIENDLGRGRPRRLEVDMTGVTLQQQLEFLVEDLGFQTLFEETGMRCFANSPSIRSSLKALRSPTAEWARRKIEYLYIRQKKHRGHEMT